MLNWRAHLIYWIAPTVVIGALIGMYFSDIGWLMSLLAPQISRELGLLESLQNLALLGIIGMAGWRAFHAHASERVFFSLIVAGGVFMLLEELDYGTHYLWAITGWDPASRPVLNVHNKGDASDSFKNVGNIILVLWFVIFPFAGRRFDSAWVRFLRPPRQFSLAVLASFLLSDAAHWLEENAAPTPHYLPDSMSEFRELFTYYIGLLYVAILVRFRGWPGWASRNAAH